MVAAGDVLLDREQELTRLRALLSSAQAGTGVVAVVEGPAGIGKTRLLEAALAEAVASGMLVLRVRASELEAGYSFGVVRQLFEPAVSQAGEVTAMFAGAAALARPLVDPGAPTRAAAEHAFAYVRDR